ncbi:MAG: prolyl oligopeptidase family serine peptidase [Eubacteriales bacterium]
MKLNIKSMIGIFLSVVFALTLFGCQAVHHDSENTKQPENDSISYKNDTEQTDNNSGTNSLVTAGKETYRGFLIDNVYHSEEYGEIHFNLYVPDSYDGSTPYALYLSLCGYGGYYFQGVGINLRQENFVFEAQKYNPKMIIVSPQLNDWGNASANQAIVLTEYFLSSYNIDENKVFMNGYSGGGETLSLVVEKCPELFTAVLHVSSVWDGALEPLADSRTPVYFVIGKNDEYYGSARISATYERLCELYRKQGLDDAQISDLAVLDIKETEYFTERGTTNQHGGGALFAYDSEIMGWLFNR